MPSKQQSGVLTRLHASCRPHRTLSCLRWSDAPAAARKACVSHETLSVRLEISSLPVPRSPLLAPHCSLFPERSPDLLSSAGSPSTIRLCCAGLATFSFKRRHFVLGSLSSQRLSRSVNCLRLVSFVFSSSFSAHFFHLLLPSSPPTFSLHL